MIDLATLRVLAWQNPALDPCSTCAQTSNHRCRTAGGAVTVPHKPRMDAAKGWVARQSEVDELQRGIDQRDAAITGLTDGLRDVTVERDRLTRDVDDAGITIRALLEGVNDRDASIAAVTLQRDNLRAEFEAYKASHPDVPVPPVQRTLFGACPEKPGGTTLVAQARVIEKWGKGAAIRQFLSGITQVAPRHAGAGIVHVSWKEFSKANLTPAKVEAACANLLAGDCVEVIHESDNDGLTGQALADRIALKSLFYDVVKTVRPDLLVVNTLTGWALDPKSGTDLSPWGRVKADVLGVDCDGIRPTKLPYTNYEDETKGALKFIATYADSGYRWFSVPEFGCPRIPAADPDGSIRAAWHDHYAALWSGTGKCLAVTLYEYDSSPNYSLTLTAELTGWHTHI